jgi:choline kinase
MNFIILADKYQKGMKSKGGLGLLKLNTRTNMIDHQYKQIKSTFPKAKIVYVYGFDHKRIQNFFKEKNYKDIIEIYNPHYDKYNFTYSLKLAVDYLNKDCIITFGDVAFKSNVFKTFNKSNGSQVFINKKQKHKIGCTIIDNYIAHISFDLDNYLSQMYYIAKKDIGDFRELVIEDKFKNYFLFEIINKLIDKNVTFHPFIKNNKNLIFYYNQTKVKS